MYMLTNTATKCTKCCKSIHGNQSFITCVLCKLSYHIRCIFTDVSENWYCFNCTGEIFPFNHYLDDDEFKFALHCFDNTIEFNRMLSLKFNPYNFEDMFHSSQVESDNLNDHSNPPNKCSYVFDKSISGVNKNDFSIIHFNSKIKNFALMFSTKVFLISSPRIDRRSGGSALYVHNSVSYRIRNDLKLTVCLCKNGSFLGGCDSRVLGST